MFRLLALLQLTRAALAFTAVADAWAVLLLRPPGIDPEPMPLTILKMLIISVASAGLYGFGMSLNDLLDARRDRIFAPRRPIPSGRIHPRTAVVIALLLLMLALLAAAFLGILGINPDRLTIRDLIPWPFFFAFAAAMLIVFYDSTAKYLGGIGIVTLGAIRALHCLIGHPRTPLLFLSMFLLTHVFLVSLIAYRLENKRPRLRRWDTIIGFLAMLAGNAAAIVYMYFRGTFHHNILPYLLGPGIALLAFALWAFLLLTRAKLTPRQKGERLMLLGLFWLFVYDASMLLSNGQPLAAVSVVLLLLCAIISFFAIRTLSRRLTQPRMQFRLDSAIHKSPSK